jgi:hypothetical protein
MDRSLTLVGGDLWNVLTTSQVRQQRADRLFAAVRAGQRAWQLLHVFRCVTVRRRMRSSKDAAPPARCC